MAFKHFRQRRCLRLECQKFAVVEAAGLRGERWKFEGAAENNAAGAELANSVSAMSPGTPTKPDATQMKTKLA